MRLLAAGTAALLLLVACSSSGRTPAPSATRPATTAVTSTQPPSATSTTGGPTSSPPTSQAPGASRPAHVVVVVLENHSFDEVLHAGVPFLDSLASSGAVLTQSYGVTHPSEPNYLALFSGSTQGVSSDACPLTFGGGNLGRSLLDAGLSFTGYSEDLPSAGFTGCDEGGYARKHSPWVDFSNLPAGVNQPFSAFPHDYAALPTVSFVIPNLDHDMHDGTLAQADGWLRANLGGYAAWAGAHNSLLVITTDEDDFGATNHIATLIVGAGVIPGQYDQHVDHYGLLRTIEDWYGLAPLGRSAQARPITGIRRGG